MKNKKGFILGLNGFIFFIYVLCLGFIVFSDSLLIFRIEAAFFLLFLAVTYPFLFAITERWKYLLLFFMRFISLLILFRTLKDDYLFLNPLLAIPALCEVALFLQPRTSILLSILITGISFLYFYSGLELTINNLFNPEYQAAVIQLFVFTLLDLGIGISMILMVHYRERFVEMSNSSESLSDVVGNIMQNNMKLQYYAVKEGAEAARKERQYLTREIHDCVGYSLSNTTMILNAAAISDSMKERDTLIRSAREMTNQCLQETRSILHRLRLPEIEYSNCLTTIKKLVKTFEGATGINIDLHLTNFPMFIDDEVRSAFYRFIQVGLVNSFTHGKATIIRIIMGVTEDFYFVQLWDNGIGIAQNFKKGIGLTGMAERLDSMGGSLTMRNCVDGFEIRASVPNNGKK